MILSSVLHGANYIRLMKIDYLDSRVKQEYLLKVYKANDVKFVVPFEQMK